jgi:hypothetical protein
MVATEPRTHEEAVLVRRAERAEHAVAELSEVHNALADEVLTAYRTAVEGQGRERQEAFDWAVSAFGSRILRVPPDAEQHMPITHAELDAADEQVEARLVRVAAAERARAELAQRPEVTVREVIGIFEEYRTRHGHGPDEAANAALTEVAEGNLAYLDIARGELELREASR